MGKSYYSFLRLNSFLCLVYVLMDFDVAYAYIDPGTTSVAFSALGYIVSIVLIGVSFFIRPFRYLLKSMFHKLTGRLRGTRPRKMDEERSTDEI